MTFFTPARLMLSMFLRASSWNLPSSPILLTGSPVHSSSLPRIADVVDLVYEDGAGGDARVAHRAGPQLRFPNHSLREDIDSFVASYVSPQVLDDDPRGEVPPRCVGRADLLAPPAVRACVES